MKTEEKQPSNQKTATQRQINHNLLIGKWQIAQRDNNQCIENWIFQPNRILIQHNVCREPAVCPIFKCDGDCNGCATARITATEYTFYPDTMELYVDRSDYSNNGDINACFNETYAIDLLSESSLLLRENEYVQTLKRATE